MNNLKEQKEWVENEIYMLKKLDKEAFQDDIIMLGNILDTIKRFENLLNHKNEIV